MKSPKIKYRNITISGRIATGTSTLAKNLEEILKPHGWTRINAGDVTREYDRKHGQSEHFTGADKRSDEYERGVEDLTKKKLTEESKLIYEAWLSGFVARDIKDVLRVLLICKDDLRIDRLVNRDSMAVDEAKKQIESRERGNIQKWHALYGEYDFWDPAYYNLVIDTYSSGPNETVGKVLDAIGYTNGS